MCVFYVPWYTREYCLCNNYPHAVTYLGIQYYKGIVSNLHSVKTLISIGWELMGSAVYMQNNLWTCSTILSNFFIPYSSNDDWLSLRIRHLYVLYRDLSKASKHFCFTYFNDNHAVIRTKMFLKYCNMTFGFCFISSNQSSQRWLMLINQHMMG